MDEKIQNLLGTDYKEGMSTDDALKIIASKNLADLSTGKYVDKNKFDDREKSFKELQKQLQEKEQEINARLTEEEKLKAEKEKRELERETEIAELKKRVAKSEAEKVLVSTGLEQVEYKDLLEKLILNSPDQASELAQSFSKVITSVKEKAKKDIETEIAKNLENPAGGGEKGTTSEFKQFIDNQPKKPKEVKL